MMRHIHTPAVEICRTVFADNPARMDYNDHKHNRCRYRQAWRLCQKETAGGPGEKMRVGIVGH